MCMATDNVRVGPMKVSRQSGRSLAEPGFMKTSCGSISPSFVEPGLATVQTAKHGEDILR